MKTNLPAILAVGLLVAINTGALAAVNVEQQVVGPIGEKEKYIVSQRGGRLGTVSPKGSRVTVVVDGVAGPRFDEILETSAGTIDPRPYANADPNSWGPQGSQITFSKDGSRYAYVGRLDQEWVVMVDNKESFRMPAGGAVGAVAGIAGSAGNTDLRIEFSGQSGKHVLIARSVYGGYELWVDGKKWPGLYTSGGGGTDGTVDPLISPDGEHIAYVAQVSREKRAVILDGKDAGYFGTQLQFTPDSKHLICVSDGPKGQAVLVDGKPFLAAKHILGVHVPPVGNRIIVAVVQMSPDGNSAQGSLLMVDGKPATATLTAEPMIKKVVFSPDGKRYAAICGPNGNQFVVIDGKKGQRYGSVNDRSMGDMMTMITFSADSSRVAYTATSTSTGHFVVVNEEESDAMQSPWFKFSADGKRLAHGGRTLQGQSSVLFVDGKLVPLPPGWFVDSFTFSPDGSRYAFNGTRGGEKGVFLDGKNTEVAGEFAFSPDGKRLAVAGIGGPEKKPGLFVDGQLVFETYDKPVRNRGFTADGRHFLWEAREPAIGAKAAPGVYEYVTYVDGVPAARVVDPASRAGSPGVHMLYPPRTAAQSQWKMPPAWNVNAAGKLVFFAADDEGVKRFGVTPPADTSVDTMIAEAKEAPVRAAAKAAEEKKKAADELAAKKAKREADAAEAAAKAKSEYEARVAKQKADYDATMAKRKADYDVLLAKQKADREAALAKQAELLKQKQQKK